MSTFPKLSVLFCGPDGEVPQRKALSEPFDGVKFLGGRLVAKNMPNGDPPETLAVYNEATEDWVVLRTGESYTHVTILADDFIRTRWESKKS